MCKTMHRERAFLSLETNNSGTMTSKESTKTNEVLAEVGTGYENIVIICDDSRKPWLNCVDVGLENSRSTMESKAKTRVAEESLVR